MESKRITLVTVTVLVVQVIFVFVICYQLEVYTVWFYGGANLRSINSGIVPLPRKKNALSKKLHHAAKKLKNDKKSSLSISQMVLDADDGSNGENEADRDSGTKTVRTDSQPKANYDVSGKDDISNIMNSRSDSRFENLDTTYSPVTPMKSHTIEKSSHFKTLVRTHPPTTTTKKYINRRVTTLSLSTSTGKPRYTRVASVIAVSDSKEAGESKAKPQKKSTTPKIRDRFYKKSSTPDSGETSNKDKSGSHATTNSLSASTYSKAPSTIKIESKKVRFRPDRLMLFSEVFDNVKDLKKVELLVICLTAPFRADRRKAIRQTWWKSCKNNPKVACWFYTDNPELIKNEKVKTDLLEEQKKYNDIILSPIGKGIHFGYRFLHLIQWGMANYDFNYIMRMDDDILFCVDHLLTDLPHFPKENVHWGYLHCEGYNIVYIDEGMSMFSNDVIVKFLSQNPKEILCHPYGDQTFTIWEQNVGLDLRTLFHPTSRGQDHPPASYDERFKTMTNICDGYIYLHGVYANDMKKFWERRGNGKYNTYKRRSSSEFCQYKPYLDWRLFGPPWHYEPKPCIGRPRWPDTETSYSGREKR